MRAAAAAAVAASALAAALAPAPARAQLFEGGARALALGRAATALDADAWAEANPAAWAGLDGPAAEAFAAQPFGLAELRTLAAAAAAPTPAGTAAVVLRTYGFDDYRETRLSAGLARVLPLGPARGLAAGLRLDYHHVAIADGFGSAGVFGLSVGVQADVLPGVRAGLAARNVTALGRSDERELTAPLSTSPAVAVGVAFRPAERALVLLDVEKDEDFPLVVRGGVEVRPLDAVALRAGGSTGVDGDAGAPARLSFGVGFRAGPVRADVAVERHEALGLSPAFTLGVRF
jgi:hypothetical protein